MLLTLIQALRRKISWPSHVGGCRKGSLKFLSCCAPRGAHNLGVLLLKWTQSSILFLGSETACLYYRWKFGCDCDSVLWLVVLWQRNHDSQLPLTQQGHASQGWALTMVLICPCRPHRLLRDEDYILFISKIVKKAEIIDALHFYFFSVAINLANSSWWSLHLSHFQCLMHVSCCQNVMAFIAVSTNCPFHWTDDAIANILARLRFRKIIPLEWKRKCLS